MYKLMFNFSEEGAERKKKKKNAMVALLVLILVTLRNEKAKAWLKSNKSEFIAHHGRRGQGKIERATRRKDEQRKKRWSHCLSFNITSTITLERLPI